jgi:hypothetical protein
MDTNMTTGKNSKATLAQQLVAGIQKHLSSTASLTLSGASYTPAQVTQSLQAIVDLRSGVETARAATQAKVVAEKEKAPAALALMAALVGYLRVAYSNSPDVLADFGLKPKKVPTSQTTEAKAQSAAKRVATRVARHTMGKNQKKAIHGAAPTTAPAGGGAQAPATAPSTGAVPAAPKSAT